MIIFFFLLINLLGFIFSPAGLLSKYPKLTSVYAYGILRGEFFYPVEKDQLFYPSVKKKYFSVPGHILKPLVDRECIHVRNQKFNKDAYHIISVSFDPSKSYLNTKINIIHYSTESILFSLNYCNNDMFVSPTYFYDIIYTNNEVKRLNRVKLYDNFNAFVLVVILLIISNFANQNIINLTFSRIHRLYSDKFRESHSSYSYERKENTEQYDEEEEYEYENNLITKYYEVFGLNEGATWEQIKAKYRELVKNYHPDRFTDENQKKQAEEKMKEINEAYDYFKRKFQ
ncbi:MAG: DnaJ domain-containing protein [Candidatus Micrarchaeia archaeon]